MPRSVSSDARPEQPIAVGTHVTYHGRSFVVTGSGTCHWCKRLTLVVRNTLGNMYVVHQECVSVVNSLLTEGSTERQE